MAELRKVCMHPAVLPEYASAGEDPDAAEAQAASPGRPAAAVAVKAEEGDQAALKAAAPGGAPALVESSGKLRVLQQLLPALHAAGHKVLLLSHSRKVSLAPRSSPHRGLSSRLHTARVFSPLRAGQLTRRGVQVTQ